MSFSDNDPLEDDMGVRCENMTPDQLVAYIKSYQNAFGLNLRIDGTPERAVFRAMQRIYGHTTAGQIVKWVFYHHKGRWGNEPVTPFSFSKGRKWWVDKMHLELQEALRKETTRTYTSATLGGRGLADL